MDVAHAPGDQRVSFEFEALCVNDLRNLMIVPIFRHAKCPGIGMLILINKLDGQVEQRLRIHHYNMLHAIEHRSYSLLMPVTGASQDLHGSFLPQFLPEDSRRLINFTEAISAAVDNITRCTSWKLHAFLDAMVLHA